MGFKVSFKGQVLDLQDLTDLFDESRRQIEKLEKEIDDLVQYNKELVLLLDIERRKNIDAK